MALTGLHVVCGSIGGFGAGGQAQQLLRRAIWSQTMAAAGTTGQSAPDVAGAEPSFELRASIDVFVAIGPNPDATTGPRIFIPANETRNLFCTKGDFVAWVAA